MAEGENYINGHDIDIEEMFEELLADGPTKAEVVAAVVADAAFRSAVKDEAGAELIADAAVTAALMYIGLRAMTDEALGEVAGHG